MGNKPSHHMAGFTLIELLVVISIITFLIGEYFRVRRNRRGERGITRR